MSNYSLLVTFHLASVIVWLGCSTTLVFFTIYALRASSGSMRDQIGALTWWMTLWVLVPASLAAPGFGVLAAHAGHWPDIFFFHVGEGAFTFSFLLTVGVRLPLLRRARQDRVAPSRLPRYLLALALAELTVLYVTVADMVFKPSGIGVRAVHDGGVVLLLGLGAAVAIAIRARVQGAFGGVNSTIERVDFAPRVASPARARRRAPRR
jgi:hypothetical protein